MNLCSDGHDEVCYLARYCPVCDLRACMQATIDGLNDELESRRRED